MINFSKLLFAISVIGLVAYSAVQHSAGGASNIPVVTNPDSLLFVPSEDFRREWVQLGSFSVLSEEADSGAKELHVVYSTEETVEAYRRNGVFPDSAILVKEVFKAKTEDLTTGRASFAGKLIGRFVMVKDKTNKYAGRSPLWGDEWGWAFYEGAESRKTVTKDYRNDCLGCHEPARSQDLVFSQGYPLLRR